MKIKTIVILSLLINLSSLNIAVAQVKNYIVITLEMTQNKKLDGLKSTQWIIPVDSLQLNSKRNVYPFFIESFSINNLTDCKNNNRINPFVFTTATNYNFDKTTSDSLLFLSKIVRLNRKKIQVLRKDFSSGYRETVKVYATPISAILCNCELYQDTRFDIGYKGLIFLPVSNFHEYDDFWLLTQSNFIRKMDFSTWNLFNVIWK